MTFTATLSAVSSKIVTVAYATADGTATSPADYTVSAGTLTFNPGVVTRTFTVPVVGDTRDEFDETFFANLSSPVNATIADSQGVGTIVDNDPTPSVGINNVTVTEVDAGSVTATFTATLSAVSGRTVTVDYATSDVTATAPADYTAASGTLTFAPGVTTRTIPITVQGDLSDEANETYRVTLSNPTNVTIATAIGTGTITDNDLPPSIVINDVSLTEGNAGTTNMNFDVSLSVPSGLTVTVNYATANSPPSSPATTRRHPGPSRSRRGRERRRSPSRSSATRPTRSTSRSSSTCREPRTLRSPTLRAWGPSSTTIPCPRSPSTTSRSRKAMRGRPT